MPSNTSRSNVTRVISVNRLLQELAQLRRIADLNSPRRRVRRCSRRRTGPRRWSTGWAEAAGRCISSRLPALLGCPAAEADVGAAAPACRRAARNRSSESTGAWAHALAARLRRARHRALARSARPARAQDRAVAARANPRQGTGPPRRSRRRVELVGRCGSCPRTSSFPGSTGRKPAHPRPRRRSRSRCARASARRVGGLDQRKPIRMEFHDEIAEVHPHCMALRWPEGSHCGPGRLGIGAA